MGRLSAASPERSRQAAELVRRHLQLGQGPFGGQRRPLGQRQRAHLVDHARQLALARPEVVEEADADLAEEAGPPRDAGQPRRQRRLPFARHDQRLAVTAGAQRAGERPLPGHAQAPPRQVGDDRLAHPRHVIGERRAQAATDHVDRALGIQRPQHLHHRMAAHEIADPDIGYDQDRLVRWRRFGAHGHVHRARRQSPQFSEHGTVEPAGLIQPRQHPLLQEGGDDQRAQQPHAEVVARGRECRSGRPRIRRAPRRRSAAARDRNRGRAG